jgi:hypothetical protein
MALDTAIERLSAAWPLLPFRGVGPAPDGMIPAADRASIVFLYGFSSGDDSEFPGEIADTATARASAAWPLLPSRAIGPMPDGTLSAGDRPVIVYLYGGAGADETPVPPVPHVWVEITPVNNTWTAIAEAT